MKWKKLLCILALSGAMVTAKAQLTNGVTGLLHMPNAEMQRSGTFLMGGNYLNEQNNILSLHTPAGWEYDTFNYYVNITFFPWLEVSYVCTLNQGTPGGYWPEQTWGKHTNQDRHFVMRLRPISEGQYWKYMPAIVLGASDPTTGSGGDYTNMAVEGSGNGYFNVWYVAATKHFQTRYGEVGAHLAYLYNKRTDYPLNSPAVGVDFKPNVVKGLDLIAEYDAKTINVGGLYSLFHDHVNLLLELQACKYISGGITYKVNLVGDNHWKKEKKDK